MGRGSAASDMMRHDEEKEEHTDQILNCTCFDMNCVKINFVMRDGATEN